MLPTSYSGDATIDGEPVEAELNLDADDLRLTIGDDEVLRWPLTSFEIELKKEGNYQLQRGDERFLFTPAVDDGLGEELALRRRFSAEPAAEEPGSGTIADRVRDAGRGSHKRSGTFGSLKVTSWSIGRDLSLGAAVLILGLLAVIVLGVALISGAFSSDPGTVEAADDGVGLTVPTVQDPSPPPSTAPATAPPTSAPTAPATTAPTAPPTTAPPPTVAESTVTTAPPSSVVVPGDLAAFAMTSEQIVERWDALARPLSGSLTSEDVELGEDSFAFVVGQFIRVSGDVGPDGLVDRFVFTGDPSGTRDDDRDVLSALGLSVAIVEPSLPPEGRRELISSLGLDLENPVLGELDGTLDYLEKTYHLRWDDESQLMVFEVYPVGEGSAAQDG